MEIDKIRVESNGNVTLHLSILYLCNFMIL